MELDKVLLCVGIFIISAGIGAMHSYIVNKAIMRAWSNTKKKEV